MPANVASSENKIA